MKAQKVTVEIKIESLSIDVIEQLLLQMIQLVDKEVESGELSYADGDTITWETKRENVEI